MLLVGESLLASDANRLQRKKLSGLLNAARSNVALYRQLYADVEFKDDRLTVREMLAQLPVATKGNLLSAPAEDRLDSRFVGSQLIAESTTGSTGQPLTLRTESAYVRKRNWRFYHALLSAGYRPWQRIMLLSDRHSESRRNGINRYYEAVEQPTSAIMRSYQRIRPHVLYGFLAPLKLLAERVLAQSQNAARPKLVISTAEMLDPSSRLLLERAFECPICDFYGMTETGLVAWQHPASERYIMSPNSVLTELIPDSSTRDRYRMVMTNLDLHASPIIRYDSGDLARIAEENGRPVIVAIEGRRIDSVVRRDGTLLSPYRITDAFGSVPGLKQFMITQRHVSDFLIEIDIDEEARESATDNIQQILVHLLDEKPNIEFQFRGNLAADGLRKFRPVRSHVIRP